MGNPSHSTSNQIFALWLYLLYWQVECQVLRPYAPLPSNPYSASNDGVFTWPSNTSSIFDEGSTLPIQWMTDYPSIELYFNYVHNISPSAGILGYNIVSEYLKLENAYKRLVTSTCADGYESTSFDWVVTCKPHGCLSPFNVEATNATGNMRKDFDSDGFYSPLFWIRPAASATSSASKPLHSNSDNLRGPNRIAVVAVGVGVGLGVALLLLGAFIPWRRHNKNSPARYWHSPEITNGKSGTWPEESWFHQAQTPPVRSEAKELSGLPTYVELHELPSKDYS